MIDSGKKKILLVEDEAIIAMNQRMVLERNGYSVIIAGNGDKAVQLAESESGLDLVLMDIDLGKGMDGTEAARTILATRDLPIVFLSSHTEPEVVEKTEGITSFGYIVKNSGETVLLASIKIAFRLFDSRQRDPADLGKGLAFTALDISERKHAGVQHEYHEALERMVIGLAVRFMESPGIVPSADIQRSLRELGEFCSVDRSYIFTFDESLETMSNTHEWCARGIEPQIGKLQNCPVDVAPWWIDTLLSAGEISIPQVSSMPLEAAAEREMLESQGIRSLLVVGFRRNGCLAGYLGFDSVREERSWTPDVVALMHVVAGLFAVVLCRKPAPIERREVMAAARF